MNLVFTFDSILSAMALSCTIRVIISAMIVSGLFIVGVILITEREHLAHVHLFGDEFHPTRKTTLEFALTVLVIVNVLQSCFWKKLSMMHQLKTSYKSYPL